MRLQADGDRLSKRRLPFNACSAATVDKFDRRAYGSMYVPLAAAQQSTWRIRK